MTKKVLSLILLILLPVLVLGQGTAGTNAKYEYRHFVDMPSSGILNKGFVGVAFKNLPNGVVIGGLEAGVFENFSFGLSYGGENIIGSGKVEWYKIPAFNLRFRAIDETIDYPAVTLGLDTQGKGAYIDSTNRYEIKSPGIYVAAAKTFELLGYVVVSGSMNYSLEKDDDNDVNFGLGLEKTIGKFVSVFVEYDFALNDNASRSLGDGEGYLNAGVRWSVGDGFTVGFDLRDMLKNKKFNGTQADRALFVEYIQPIF